MKRKAKLRDQIYRLRGDRNVPCCTHQKTRKLVEALGRSYERDGTHMANVMCCVCSKTFEELSKVIESGIVHGECMICLSCEYSIVCRKEEEGNATSGGKEGEETERTCPVCRSKELQTVYRHYKMEGIDQPFIQCLICGNTE